MPLGYIFTSRLLRLPVSRIASPLSKLIAVVLSNLRLFSFCGAVNGTWGSGNHDDRFGQNAHLGQAANAPMNASAGGVVPGQCADTGKFY